jgi:hypothetical protein
MMNNTQTQIAAFFGAIVVVALAAVLLAWPTQILWNNCLVPAVEGINGIGFWQALGINFLFSILFKSSTRIQKNND